MGNIIIGAPIGGSRACAPTRRAASASLAPALPTADDFFDVDENSFGVNVGAGVMGFVRENFGLRGDVRYFRSVQDSDVGDDIDVDFGSFDFWRGTVGATFRFSS